MYWNACFPFPCAAGEGGRQAGRGNGRRGVAWRLKIKSQLPSPLPGSFPRFAGEAKAEALAN